MSFSWSAPSNPSLTGMKSATTNSFADALKRLAEHVEERNKTIDANNGGASTLVQSSITSPNRITLSHVNNSLSPEQALRLYTQYVHEAEKREDIRRSYLRAYGGSERNSPTLNRRLDNIDTYRFMAPHFATLLHPSAYFQSLAPQTTVSLSPASPFSFSNIKTADTSPRISTQESADKPSEQSSQFFKPKSKLFRPYDLDSSNSSSHQTSPTAIKKSASSPPSTVSTSTSTFSDESSSVTSSGKEKQLFNSLGLIQQATEHTSEKCSLNKTSPSRPRNEDPSSTETPPTQQDKSLTNTNNSPLPVMLKRKSVFSTSARKSSNPKQSRIEPVQTSVD